jgi:hypothetical protein
MVSTPVESRDRVETRRTSVALRGEARVEPRREEPATVVRVEMEVAVTKRAVRPAPAAHSKTAERRARAVRLVEQEQRDRQA